MFSIFYTFRSLLLITHGLDEPEAVEDETRPQRIGPLLEAEFVPSRIWG